MSLTNSSQKFSGMTHFNNMTHQDRLFGKIEITEPVVLDIISLPKFQRLKGIDQAGYFEPYYPGTSYNRFEHSIGCYFLLKKFNASPEEQIAGLIHDISHSAFSHCIDYALQEGSEMNHDHQDNIFAEYVLNSDIPKILKKYNLNINYILDEANFPLQETELPDLCADRIDYSLRGLIAYGEISQQKAQSILDNLIIKNNKWVFKNIDAAKEYSKLFYNLNKKYYTGIETAMMFRTVGDYVKHAIKNKYITYDELYTNDRYVINTINTNLTTDIQLTKLWRRMNDNENFKNDKTDYDAHIFCKSRIVDPLVMAGNKIKRFSELEINWEDVVKEESKPKEYFIKFLD